jgi:glycosyltransferase involved in cell wall biosynthesis
MPPTWRGRTLLVLLDALQEVMPDSFPWHTRWRFAMRYRQAARRATRVIVPSHATATDVRRIYGVSEARLRVVPPGPAPGFRPRPPDGPDVRRACEEVGVGSNPYFLFVGKRSKRRNVPAILEAFRMDRRDHPEHHLVFAGPEGDDGAALRREPGVLLSGHLPETTLQALMCGSLGLLYPSAYEGFGLPVLEALASGCPVVTLSNSALTEAGGEGAWYVESPAPATLAATMNSIVADRGERERRIALGLAHAARLNATRFAESVARELQDMADPVHDHRAAAGGAAGSG